MYHWITRVSISSPREQRPDKAGAGSSKKLASSFYQLKTGHCLTGQYLEWRNQPTARCWWCIYRTQTRDHLFKNCPRWKPQQKTLWVEVRKRKRSVQGPWPLGRYEVQPAGVGLSLHHRCRGGA